MTRLLITASTDNPIECFDEVLVLNDGLVIPSITIQQPPELVGKDLFLPEIRGNHCRIGEIIVMGQANDASVEDWIATVSSGLKITGDGNLVGKVHCEYVHRPLLVTGKANQIGRLDAYWFSGDPYNLCNHYNIIHHVSAAGALAIFPYEEYHLDKAGMMFLSANQRGEALIGCEVWNYNYTFTNHPLEAKQAQGFLADGITERCRLVNFDIPDSHPEHGLTFADARNCEVINAQTYGAAVTFDRRSKNTLSCEARGNCHL